jgi:flagellum-specific ATP synthase
MSSPANHAPLTELDRIALSFAAGRTAYREPRLGGEIVSATPVHYRVAGIAHHVQLGDCVEHDTGTQKFMGQVVRIDADHATVVAFEGAGAVGLGQQVWCRGPLALAPANAWRGRVIDALARPLDQKGTLAKGRYQLPADGRPPGALHRQRVSEPIRTGVKAIDLLTPLCAGQRIGVFAGSGVGKSTLLGMLAQAAGFDTTVIALVGERGREVREFLDDILGPALAKSVVVVATGDESPMMRRQAPRTAMLAAEYFRDQGQRVLLVIDSVTRYAHALREVGLAGGEPPVARGYTPGVFADLPRLLERAGPGTDTTGSITGVFSVLVDGDDHNEPIADAVRGILDGHVVLDRAIATRGQFPAIDALRSISRLAGKSHSASQQLIVRQLRAAIAAFEDSRDLRMMGAYRTGSNAELDRAVKMVPQLYEFLTQQAGVLSPTDVFQELATRMPDWT